MERILWLIIRSILSSVVVIAADFFDTHPKKCLTAFLHLSLNNYKNHIEVIDVPRTSWFGGYTRTGCKSGVQTLVCHQDGQTKVCTPDLHGEKEYSCRSLRRAFIMPVFDILGFIPHSLKQQVIDTLVDFVSGEAKSMSAAKSPTKLKSCVPMPLFRQPLKKDCNRRSNALLQSMKRKTKIWSRRFRLTRSFLKTNRCRRPC